VKLNYTPCLNLFSLASCGRAGSDACVGLARVSQRLVSMVIAGLFVCLLGACASAPQHNASGDDVAKSDVDKFEGFNRAVFSFNDTLDRWTLKPVAKGYDKVVPGPIKAGIGNFFGNLGEVTNIINGGLQWKWKQAANDTGRLLMNSTVGLLGLIDVASKAGLEKNPGENFTQTLATWGVPRGSYLVLPFLGPTTLRGAGATPVDWATSPVQYLESDNARWGATAVDLIHTRAELLKAEEFASGDRYLFIREAFLQRLNYLENDGEVEDDFGDDFGDDDDYGFDE